MLTKQSIHTIKCFIHNSSTHTLSCLCRPRGRSSIIIPAGGAAASAWGTFRDALARIEAAGQVLLLVCIHQFRQFLPLTASYCTPAPSDPCKQPVTQLIQQPWNMTCSHRHSNSWHGHFCKVLRLSESFPMKWCFTLIQHFVPPEIVEVDVIQPITSSV